VANEKIIKAFLGGRCPVCALLRQDEFDYLCHWVGVSGEKYKNSEERNRILRASGFCNYHFWEYERISTHYGIAEICIGLIENIIDNLRNQREKSQLLHSQENRIGLNCPVCADLEANELDYLKDLISLLGSHENRIRYTEGWGLCIPHLIKAMAYTNDASLVLFLLETEKKQLERVKMDALELIRKKNPPLRWEQTDDEKNSGFRAIEKLVGRRGRRNE